jgi:hypothetical protein
MRIALLALAITAFVADGKPLGAQSAVPATLTTTTGPLFSSNPLLQATLERIGKRSTLWRNDLDAVGRNGRRVLVLTPDQVVVADSQDGAGAGAFDPTAVAAAAPVPDAESRVDLVLVVVNLPLIEDAHRRKGSLPGELHTDLDLIVMHEVYGHALPYLLAGHLSGRCPDPAPGQRATDACSIQRENALRKELGLGRRTSYSLRDLLLARGV